MSVVSYATTICSASFCVYFFGGGPKNKSQKWLSSVEKKMELAIAEEKWEDDNVIKSFTFLDQRERNRLAAIAVVLDHIGDHEQVQLHYDTIRYDTIRYDTIRYDV
jgi:hypothetical protein